MRTILSTAFAAALVAPLAFPEQALACSCMYYEDENQRFGAFHENADLVIQGVAVEMEETDQEHIYTIGVEKAWKGQADAYIDVGTATNSAACGISLELDERMIIFAYESEGSLHTGLCSGTMPAANAEALTEWLNEGAVSESSSSTSSSQSSASVTEENDCTPYICANGDTFPACSEDGHIISYLVAPCQFSGGEASQSSVPTEADEEFTDVSSDHPNHKAITYVRSEGIVQGYEDNTYRPEQFINRAEFTKIIVASVFAQADIDTCETTELFTDVSQSDWYADYVCQAKQADVIGGYPDGSFKPGSNVNFAEAAKIIVMSFDLATDPEDHLGVWWKPYVFALARIGGLPSTFSDPNQSLTRGDMAEMIFRVKMGIES